MRAPYRSPKDTGRRSNRARKSGNLKERMENLKRDAALAASAFLYNVGGVFKHPSGCLGRSVHIFAYPAVNAAAHGDSLRSRNRFFHSPYRIRENRASVRNSAHGRRESETMEHTFVRLSPSLADADVPYRAGDVRVPRSDVRRPAEPYISTGNTRCSVSEEPKT